MLNPTNFQSQAYESIKELILTAKLIPGQKISEKELEQRLIIGRTPIREAIIRLRREALIHVVPQSGTYISKISIKQIEEARFVRETLEKEVFVAACQAITEEQLKELEKLVILQRTYAQLKDEIEFFQLDEAFHQLIYKIADKENVWNWLQTINLPLNRFRFLRLEVEELSWEIILRDHEEILATLKEKDQAKIAPLVGQHIDVIDNDLIFVEKAFPDYFTE